jgi:hypothetical protein
MARLKLEPVFFFRVKNDHFIEVLKNRHAFYPLGAVHAHFTTALQLGVYADFWLLCVLKVLLE